MPYAENTEVSPERSQAQISETLRRYGATGFMYGWEGRSAMVAFAAHGRHIKFLLPLPDPDDRAFTLTPTGRRRSPSETPKAYEQRLRQRWRALLLAIKAKLEAVETGITTFEEEFAAHIVLPDGATVWDHLKDEIDQAYASGQMPDSLLPRLRGLPQSERPALPPGRDR